MELYVVTQLGREAVRALQQTGKNEEADILDYLERTNGATVGQVAEAMRLDENVAYDKLRSMSANRWVWCKKTKLTPF